MRKFCFLYLKVLFSLLFTLDLDDLWFAISSTQVSCVLHYLQLDMYTSSVMAVFLPVILYFILAPSLSQCFSLTILHTNDIHGRFEEINQHGSLCAYDKSPSRECYGGIARRATVIKKLRAINTNVLLLDAGDQFTGTMWNSVHKGKATRYFMNYLQYDVMVSVRCWNRPTIRKGGVALLKIYWCG